MGSAICSPKQIEDNGVIILTRVRQSGNVASRVQPIRVPDNVKGIMVRGEAVSDMAGHVTVHKEAASPQAIAISGFQRALHHSRQVAYTLSTIALLLAAAIMTYGVIVRHVVGARASLAGQGVCIFLLVGATFLSAASVQAHRGHLGIEAAVLPSI